MSSQNISKYLRYAIGEIVLVVIGILIAIQINDWNDARKEEKVKLKYFDRIQTELRELEKVIVYNTDYMKDSMIPVLKQTIKAMDEKKQLNSKDFQASLEILTENEALAFQFPIVREFLNKGSLSSVESEAVNLAFQNLEYCIKQCELVDENTRQDHLHLIKPYLNQSIPYDRTSSVMESIELDTLNADDSYADFYLRNLFANRMENLIMGRWRNDQLLNGMRLLSKEMKDYASRYE